ncbi:MAG TPA: c-type cytochrome [Terracidiphilus sp.]|jgi:mono/diheme cytochrome c family protein
MKRIAWIVVAMIIFACIGCRQKAVPPGVTHPTASGAALVETSGGKQVGTVGTALPQPIVIQVNDGQGNAVAGAMVKFRGPGGVHFDPIEGVSDSSGQFTTNVSLGGVAGRYQILVSSRDKSEREITLKLDEIATGYQQQLGYQLDQNYCSRCHSSESSPERVSNHDNLEVKPHEFTDGDTLNKMSDADLLAIISHGGPSLNRSPLMPPYGSTLSKAEIQALIAYIRVISDPPYKAAGVVYTQQ